MLFNAVDVGCSVQAIIFSVTTVYGPMLLTLPFVTRGCECQISRMKALS